ncbi:hypothetical protein ACS0TY_027475 [Phlomoides rotata]
MCATSKIDYTAAETSAAAETRTTAETRTAYDKYFPVCDAVLSGNWETTNDLFRNEEECEAIISRAKETALHVAVLSGRANAFVRRLVGMMRPQALAFMNNSGYTAFHLCAMIGNTEAARILLGKNPDLLYMKTAKGNLAITMAAKHCQKDTLVYLKNASKPNVPNTPFEGQLGIALLMETIGSEFFDVALDLVRTHPDLAQIGRETLNGKCALWILARKDTVFRSRESLSWWEDLIYHMYACDEGVPLRQHGGDEGVPLRQHGVWKPFKNMILKAMELLVPQVKGVKDKKKKHKQVLELVKYLCEQMKLLPQTNAYIMLRDSMYMAAQHGISEIVEHIMKEFPEVTTFADTIHCSIMHVAASYRFENVFNLTYNMSDRKHMFSTCEDSERNNLMHMCARLAPPNRLNRVPGAALQMQRELQWFNEMERFVPPTLREFRNNQGKTPKMLFTEEHGELKAQGEKWMKDTATACSITTALITTVVFAAAFTLPGGVSSETGIPVFHGEPAFVLFSTTNAVSLFTSITSLMMFLSILTSRYAEGDFLHVLPKRLSFGLLSLFISITFMLVAFSAALYLVFQKRMLWFILPVATFGWWPIASFVRLQFPLLVDVVYSTYGPGIFGKKIDRMLY